MAKPRSLKAKAGTLKKSRDGAGLEPMPKEALGNPVFKGMSRREREWYRMLAEMLHANTAYRPDAVALSLVAKQAALIERTPMEDLKTNIQSEFMRNLSSFGMTPSSRRHVQTQVNKEDEHGGFGRFSGKPGVSGDAVKH